MRTSVIYSPSRSPRESEGVLQPCPPTMQGIHDNDSAASVPGRSLVKRCSASVQEEGSDIHTQEPPAKVCRTEQEQQNDEASGSPNGRLDSASVGTTRSILQGVLDFFGKMDTSPSLPSLPGLPLPFSLRNVFLGCDQEMQEQKEQQQELKQQEHLLRPTGDALEDKENIPPENKGQPTARLTLHVFRERESLKRRRQETENPHPSIPPRQKPSPQLPRAPTAASGPQGEASSGVHKNSIEVTKKIPVRRSRLGDGQAPVQVSKAELIWFIQLAESPKILKFLQRDICYRYADKYLLAMVFTYFVRAGLRREQYTKEYFYAALYLAHDMEEDEEELKYEVFPWAMGPRWRKSYSSLLKVRDDIFWAIHCRAIVSKRGCDQVMAIQPECWLWQRERPSYHGGAMREYLRKPFDNGRPRGPNKSPLQCQLCLERECANSESSYLLYISDTASSVDTLYPGCAVVTEHKREDSGFETLLSAGETSLLVTVEPILKRTSAELRAQMNH